MLRPLVAGALAAGTLLLATPADAGCYGSQQFGTVCATVYPGGLPQVNPTGSSFDDCIVVDSQCTVPYSIPIPTVTGGSGPIVVIDCGGPIKCRQIEI